MTDIRHNESPALDLSAPTLRLRNPRRIRRDVPLD